MMIDQTFSIGDKVRHSGRPEWGVGTVTRAENLPLNGHRSQRVSVRFPNSGLKTLVSEHAELERVEESSDPLTDADASIAQMWEKLSEEDWLSPLAQRKIEQAMTTLPPLVRDPFNSLKKRLADTLRLYRFDRSGRGLMDWAVAQTGLDDPLSRLTRHELERYFDRWAHERDQHLSRLLQDAKGERELLDVVLTDAPPAGKDAVRRFTAQR